MRARHLLCRWRPAVRLLEEVACMATQCLIACHTQVPQLKQVAQTFAHMYVHIYTHVHAQLCTMSMRNCAQCLYTYLYTCLCASLEMHG